MQPRYEFKYVCTYKEAERLLFMLKDYVHEDPHCQNGGYHINSIYYDTRDLHCYYAKIDGEDPRFKFRLRYYGNGLLNRNPEDLSIFIEIKHRFDKTISKDRIQIDETIFSEIQTNGITSLQLSEQPTESLQTAANIISHTISHHVLQPVCRVSYYRRAFHTRIDPTLRVTIDQNLVAGPVTTDNWLDTRDGDPFLPDGLCVVEAKFHWSMPLWLMEIFSECGMKIRPYSKYCSALERINPALTVRTIQLQNPYSNHFKAAR